MSKRIGALLLVVPAAIGMLIFRKKRHKGEHVPFELHRHDPLDHEHQHVHVTHYRSDPSRGVGGWEHLTSDHTHRHNHPALEHSHRPHRNFTAEHAHEAHVHDHQHPTAS